MLSHRFLVDGYSAFQLQSSLHISYFQPKQLVKKQLKHRAINVAKELEHGTARTDINNKLVKELLSQSNPNELLDKDGLLQQLKKRIVERILQNELSHELGYSRHSKVTKPDSILVKTKKTLLAFCFLFFISRYARYMYSLQLSNNIIKIHKKTYLEISVQHVICYKYVTAFILDRKHSKWPFKWQYLYRRMGHR